jgi:hypothetical protein
MAKRIQTYEAFWPFYLSQHREPLCRALHFFGTSAGVVAFVYALATQTWWLIPLCFVMGYGPAWIGHFFIEKNRPATFTYPGWSFISDFRMLGLMATGKLWTGDPLQALGLRLEEPADEAAPHAAE